MTVGPDGLPDQAIDPAIPLGDDETAEWVGRPRRTVVLPTVLVGLAGVVGGGYLAASIGGGVPVLLGALLVAAGFLLPAGHLVRVQRTQFVVTDRALYAKRGVIGRTVTQANLETVQNSAYRQGITGSVFGYGSVEFEIAGGADLVFADIRNPSPVRALVDRATRNTDGIDGVTRRRDSIPGTLEEWRAVRGEVTALRRVVDGPR